MMGIGDEVVCINKNIELYGGDTGDKPIFGQIYVIRDISAHPWFPDVIGIRLKGMHCYTISRYTNSKKKVEAWYRQEWFRPVKKNTIDIFRQIDKDVFDVAPDAPIKKPEKENV